MQLVLNTHGLLLRVKNRVFYVTAGDEIRTISPEKIASIAITAPCMLSSAAIELAAEADIPIYFFDRMGDARSSLRSPYFESLATLRRKQVYFSDSKAGGAWVIEQFQHKTTHQVQVLKYLKNRRRKFAEALDDCMQQLENRLRDLNEKVEVPSSTWNASLMGWEGHQAKLYWRMVATCMPEEWTFQTRSRRPAKDPFNAMINYLYGMLYAVVEQALFAAGLDPHLGILHTDEYDRPTLSFDLIEPFRPWIDLLIVQKILQKEVETDFFEPVEGGYFLSDNGKRFLIPQFNSWMQHTVYWQEERIAREAHIFHAAARLARTINDAVQRP